MRLRGEVPARRALVIRARKRSRPSSLDPCRSYMVAARDAARLRSFFGSCPLKARPRPKSAIRISSGRGLERRPAASRVREKVSVVASLARAARNQNGAEANLVLRRFALCIISAWQDRLNSIRQKLSKPE